MARARQFELFAVKEPRSKKSRGPADLEALGPQENFVIEKIDNTREEHACSRCELEIPIGFRAIRLIPKENGRKNFNKIEYFHLKKDCPAWHKEER